MDLTVGLDGLGVFIGQGQIRGEEKLDSYEFRRGLVSQSIFNLMVPIYTYITPLHMGVW